MTWISKVTVRLNICLLNVRICIHLTTLPNCIERIRIEGNIGLLFVFVALRPMSTAMVNAGRSVHLFTLFPGQA